MFFAYTDGITESDNPAGDLWGQKRPENLLCHCSSKSSEEAIQCSLDGLSTFADGQRQRDDVTLLVMREQS